MCADREEPDSLQCWLSKSLQLVFSLPVPKLAVEFALIQTQRLYKGLINGYFDSLRIQQRTIQTKYA